MEKIRILLADDHVFVREGTRELLEREADLEVVGEASNGAEAASLAETTQPDVVLMDIAMPVMSGIAATARIKATCPAAAVLLLTAYDDDQYVLASLAAGADGYLMKDVASVEIVNAVRAVYSGELVLHPTIAKKVRSRVAGSGVPQRTDTVTPANGQLLLSKREVEVLRLVASGMSNGEIAGRLFFSGRTVQAHLTHIFDKLGVGSRTEAVTLALRRNLISLDDLERSDG